MAGPGVTSKRVLLIHGLWMNSTAMAVLGARLRRLGFVTDGFSYRMVSRGLEQNMARLRERIEALAGDDASGRIHLVCHSLGGVLALHSLQRYPDLQVARVVCLGSPLLDTAAGRRLAAFRWGRQMLGRTLPEAVFGQPLDSWHGTQQVGVIAGSLSAGLGMLFARRLQRPHDGVVELAETCLPGITDHVELRVNHIGMLLSREIADQTAAFLHNGRFRRR